MPTMRGVWPLYFAAQDIEGKHFRCKKGDLLPFTDPRVIRGLGLALGIPDAKKRSLSALPYVRILNAGSAEMARHIAHAAGTYEKARKLVHEEAA